MATVHLGGVFGLAGFPSGVVGSPGMYFDGDNDTGIYRPAANTLGIVAGGTEYVRVTSSGMYIGGDFTNARQTVGLTLDQGAADNGILSGKSSDVAHGVTDFAETDTFFEIKKNEATSGGLGVRGFSSAGIGVDITGIAVTDNTTKSTSGAAYVHINAYKKSGTTAGATGANANIAAIRNNDSSQWLCDAEGDVWQNGGFAGIKGITLAGYGVPAVVGYGRVAGTVDTQAAAAATYTVGASDGTFEVSGNVLVTASATHTFSLDVTYTDESNTARTLILPMAQLSGAFVTGGLITNATGAGPYESPVMHIRCKAATAITIRVSAGTFTSVTYNSEGTIKQVG